GTATGRMRWAFPGEGSASFHFPDLPRATDFFGLNYYSRAHLRFRGLPGRIGEFFYRDRDGRGLTDTGWEIHPKGFHRVLEVAAGSGLPILVTENGIATGNDRLRRAFLREHVAILNHQREAGLRIDGYFYWSLINNFEWLEGFRPRFGLFEVDYATFARKRRPSADLFAWLGRRFTRRRKVERGEGMANLPPFLERDELGQTTVSRGRQRLPVAPADFGRSMRVGGEGAGDAGRDQFTQKPRLRIELPDRL